MAENQGFGLTVQTAEPFSIRADTIPFSLDIYDRGQLMVRYNQDGSVSFGPDYTPTEAARVFWEVLAACNPLRAEVERLKAQVQELSIRPGIVLASKGA